MNSRPTALLVIVFVVCCESVSLPEEATKIINELVAAMNTPGVTGDFVIGQMKDGDKECINWYFNEIKIIEKDEKSKRKCSACELTLRCRDSNCFSQDNCCYSFAVLDRVEKLKGKFDKCKEPSGLASLANSMKVKISSSEDAAILLMKKARTENEAKCPVKSASDGPCKTADAAPAEVKPVSDAPSGTGKQETKPENTGSKGGAHYLSSFLFTYVSILSFVANILTLF